MPNEDKSVVSLPGRPPQECKVLVVDDDDRIVEVFCAILSRSGYRLLSATNGEAALELIKGEAPDVVVMDVILPDLDGIELCRRIKENEDTRFLPVILVTGLSARARRLEGLHAGADDFLNKPVDPLELTARVRSLLRTKQLYDEVETHRRELEQRVTERTQELRVAYERLHELSRVKGNVLAIVSHELNTPLVQAKSGLALAMQNGISPPQRDVLHQKVDEAFRLLEYRIRDIGVFSDPSDLKLAPVSVTDLLEAAIEQVRILRRHHDDVIEVDLPKALPPVMVDATSITRALAHVIDNSVKFGNEKQVLVSAACDETGVRVRVCDHGIGIPDDVKPHLFIPLQQGDDSITRRHGGMGIGLALVKMILDAHRIDIDIQSQVNEGTTVSFVLPIAELKGRAETSQAGGDTS